MKIGVGREGGWLSGIYAEGVRRRSESNLLAGIWFFIFYKFESFFFLQPSVPDPFPILGWRLPRGSNP